MAVKKARYGLPDSIRGLTLLSMIGYHGVWDAVYLFDCKLDWFESRAAYAWQQSICWAFILLSGFCWPMGKRRLKRGFTVFAAGGFLTLVTLLLLPENRVIFGVLTFLGFCTLFWIWPEKLCRKLPPLFGLSASLLLFALLRNVNEGWLGFERFYLVPVPGGWYRNLFTAWLGFPAADFYSVDYFSFLPWFFLFTAGYYFYRVLEKNRRLTWLEAGDIPVLNFLGRHSLAIYLLHQPLLFVMLSPIFLV